ncbi:hypothetical protein CEXT_351031 [Caerostris extrusa]|uniref:Uncharacterized protein n=1 Tax=Caerostris extrusa TaxID=172846 RepID=A0AAV4NC56_CAEEX|nr:hypothetical protein CEXT_351031 [Caerostris extrusa]
MILIERCLSPCTTERSQFSAASKEISQKSFRTGTPDSLQMEERISLICGLVKIIPSKIHKHSLLPFGCAPGFHDRHPAASVLFGAAAYITSLYLSLLL